MSSFVGFYLSQLLSQFKRRPKYWGKYKKKEVVRKDSLGGAFFTYEIFLIHVLYINQTYLTKNT